MDLTTFSEEELNILEDRIIEERQRRDQKIKDCKVQLPSHMWDKCIECDFRLECFDRTDGTHKCYDVCAETNGKQNCDICMCPCD